MPDYEHTHTSLCSDGQFCFSAHWICTWYAYCDAPTHAERTVAKGAGVLWCGTNFSTRSHLRMLAVSYRNGVSHFCVQSDISYVTKLLYIYIFII